MKDGGASARTFSCVLQCARRYDLAHGVAQAIESDALVRRHKRVRLAALRARLHIARRIAAGRLLDALGPVLVVRRQRAQLLLRLLGAPPRLLRVVVRVVRWAHLPR